MGNGPADSLRRLLRLHARIWRQPRRARPVTRPFPAITRPKKHTDRDDREREKEKERDRASEERERKREGERQIDRERERLRREHKKRCVGADDTHVFSVGFVRIVAARREFASLLGCASYADVILANRMLKVPHHTAHTTAHTHMERERERADSVC